MSKFEAVKKIIVKIRDGGGHFVPEDQLEAAEKEVKDAEPRDRRTISTQSTEDESKPLEPKSEKSINPNDSTDVKSTEQRRLAADDAKTPSHEAKGDAKDEQRAKDRGERARATRQSESTDDGKTKAVKR